MSFLNALRKFFGLKPKQEPIRGTTAEQDRRPSNSKVQGMSDYLRRNPTEPRIHVPRTSGNIPRPVPGNVTYVTYPNQTSNTVQQIVNNDPMSDMLSAVVAAELISEMSQPAPEVVYVDSSSDCSSSYDSSCSCDSSYDSSSSCDSGGSDW